MTLNQAIKYAFSKNESCYCERCRKTRKYYVYDVPDYEGRDGGKTYRFHGKQARCMVCHTMVYPQKIREYNESEFRKALNTH